MEDIEDRFVRPPDAPVFEPTVDEFKDPLAYIAKIRPIAEKTGICKIRPPSNWQPPFALDVTNFKFTPRVQRLNELEATTRVRLNFLDQIAKFYYLQGKILRVPKIENRPVDLYSLHKVIREEGGLEFVTRERKWSRVASRLGYLHQRGHGSYGSLLKQHYENILLPFDGFQTRNTAEKTVDDDEGDSKDKDYEPRGTSMQNSSSKLSPDRYTLRSKHYTSLLENSDGINYSANSELKKLQFYGAGPKMPGYLVKEDGVKSENGSKASEKSEGSKQNDAVICNTCCEKGDENMFSCDTCGKSCHSYCLIPPHGGDNLKCDRKCSHCITAEIRKAQAAFGFEQAKKEYTLEEFGSNADKFKFSYFNMPVHKVPTEMVEKEYWRILSSVDECVTVEYGADLHTADHGSGFPTRNASNALLVDEEYINNGWNLNNISVAEGSVLRHIGADISGVKVPWIYVGMCFSTFCWHNEDHWTYSINYLHWGEPKTWYGIPGGKAEALEEAMRSAAPELFESQQDLLHHLVTIMNPNTLMDAGVPIFRTDQRAGEFVVTFPRSYHAGFNQGYNFAEAVNFAPADWIPIGRVCVAHYSLLHRVCVFSHDELICKMAVEADRLNVSIASAAYQDMQKMVQVERENRKKLLQWGVADAEREAFELLPDDERQCNYCKTTCFLSAVTCACDERKLVCLLHKELLCDCPPDRHCLRYRYTVDEFLGLLNKLKIRAESYSFWETKAKMVLEAMDDKFELNELKDLIQEAKDKKYPVTESIKTLTSVVQEAEKISEVAQQLLNRIGRSSTRISTHNKGCLSSEELSLFYEQVCKLPCVIKEATAIKDLFERVKDFEESANNLLSEEMAESHKLEKLLHVGLSLNVDFPLITQIKQKLQQSSWLEEVRKALKDPHEVMLDNLKKLLDAGINLPPHPVIEKEVSMLQEQLIMAEKWEEKAKLCLQGTPKYTLSSLENTIAEAEEIPVFLPTLTTLREAVRKAKRWAAEVETVQNRKNYPYLEALETLLNKGHTIPVQLDLFSQLESQVTAAKLWKERTARTFLKKNSAYTLLEVLSPRRDIGNHQVPSRSKKKLKENVVPGKIDDDSYDGIPTKDLSTFVPFYAKGGLDEVVDVYAKSGLREVELMKQLQKQSLQKREEDNGAAKYCVCHKPFSGQMLHCELCKDWFHASCVPVPKASSLKKQNQNALPHLSKEVKYLCPMCLRSRRPRIETILSLLVSLQKLPIRLPEGEALQCLTERAMAWQSRAREALLTEELNAALAKLSILSQKLVEQAARKKTERIISTEILRAASNPELKSHLQNVAHSAFSLKTSSDDSEGLVTKVDTIPDIPEVVVPGVGANQDVPFLPEISEDLPKNGCHNDPDDYSKENASKEHAYSSMSKPALPLTPKKQVQMFPLIQQHLESPVLTLSPAATGLLEELMVEGDLLEVSLDETQHIWKILQAAKPAKDRPFFCNTLTDMKAFTDPGCKTEKKAKKRKLDTAEKLKQKARVPKKISKKVKEESDYNQLVKSSTNKIGQKKLKEPKNPTKKKCIKKVKKDEKGETVVKKRKTLPANSDDYSDDVCSASKCLRPQGAQVNWVQCDGRCEKWFHVLCVGLDMQEVENTDEYFCTNCSECPVKVETCIDSANEAT